MTTKELAEVKQRMRGMWAAGDFPAVAQRDLWPLGERVVRRAGIRAGEDVLDVACGTGNAAIRAAQAGGRVTGVDLTPELFEAGRRLAAEADVDIKWTEGDAEALPFEDESFDVVLSVLGVMFAPRHEVAAHELVRVLRPGGRMVLCNWTPDSPISQVFKTLGRYMPPPPEAASPPALWGSQDRVRKLFAGTGVDLEFERGTIEWGFDSPEENIEFHSTRFGPFMAVRALTERDGRWPALREELIPLHSESEGNEYLLVTGRKRA